MSLGVRIKDPNDIRTYTINWATWLGTDTISLSVWELPGDLTNVSESNTPLTTSTKLGGGVSGQTYTIINRITTTAGETKQVSFTLVVSTQ